jgi:hypothetical protein
MRHPALVFGPELMRSIDAAHAKYDGWKSIGPGVVEHILIRCPLGAAVGAVKIERPVLADAGAPKRRVGWLVALIAAAKAHILQGAVHLVGGGEHHGRRLRLRS